jgi:uncharacterized protein YbjT (DUF2867 family)
MAVRCRVRLLLAFIAVVAPLSEAAFAPAARAGGRAPFAAVRARAPVASLLDPLAAAQLPASLGLVADAAGSPPAFDLLDVVLVSPVLVGFFAVWAISSASDAGKAGSAKAQAERVAAAAQRAKEREEKNAEALAKKVAEEQEAKDRKIQFFNKKLSSDRKEMEEKAKKQTENLRRDLQREREKLRESERTIRELRAELRKAQSDASYVSPPPKAPPPPMPSPPAAAVSVAAAAATAAVEPPPLAIAASAGGKTRLRPGVSSGDVIVVTGASGRTGKLVVEQLLALYPGAKIRAAGRDLATLGAAFPSPDKRVELVGADLYDKESDTFKGLFEGASAVVWCASSFGQSDPDDAVAALIEKALLTFDPTAVLDAGGVKGASAALQAGTALLQGDAKGMTPKFVLLSSAAVTRPSWDAPTKAAFADAANIPIVQLNPKNILGLKAVGEAALRECGLPYCIVRPCGLSEEVPSGRLVLSSGDVATGKIGRTDLAFLLASLLGEPSATGKTVEAFGLPDMPKVPLGPVLEGLSYDSGPAAPAPNPAAYSVLRQLAPAVDDK